VGGTLTVRLAWPSGSHAPSVTLSLTGVAVGPVVLDGITVGFDGDAVADLVLRLDMPGMLAPLRPAFELGVDHGRFTSRILPLGAAEANDFALTLAPTLDLHATDRAAIDMVTRWGLPLAVNIIVAAVGPSILDTPIWTFHDPDGTTRSGPTARQILDHAGLTVPPTGPQVVGANWDDLEPATMALRAFQKAIDGLSFKISETLSIGVATDADNRTGVRLSGYQNIEADDMTVRVFFGAQTTWFDDPDGGATVWLIGPNPDPATSQVLPLWPTPGLSLVGVGVILDGKPTLVDGSVVIGSAGAVIFLNANFPVDTHGTVTVDAPADGIGGALVVERSYINIGGGDGDSFIAKVLPTELKSPFDLAVIYRDGELSFGGTSPLSTGHIEFVIPLNLDFTVIKVTELVLGLTIATGRFSIEAALSGGADVGPVVATIKRVGLIASFGQGGFGLRFRAPDMVGLAIDASTIRLGGFLLIDSERGRYIGGIEIAILGKLELTAIGIITTKNPDGSPGFSLLFIISMILPVPISMSYGFFFGGAGGLLGLNRGLDLDALRNGLRTGTAENILFPKDIVRRAEAIVRDLEAVFPIAQGQFVVGPMVLITWMNPPLVTVKLGIILELGTPIRVGILGLLQLALPDPADAILNLKCAFLGAVDFAAGLLSFDAAIYDSGIGFGDFKIAIEGDIALRLSWGAKPDFLHSVGGFHPAFHPDAHLRLPQMRRLSVSLLKDNPHITMGLYFAITCNSLQLGSKLDFGFEVAGFSIVGEFGFDVLIQFSPFLLDAAIYARLLVKGGGKVLMQITADLTLRGPTPWIARGTAVFSVLFFTVHADFEKVFGPPLEPAIPDTALLPPLIAELCQASNWTAQVPAGTVAVVALLPVEPAEGSVVIEPSGTVAVTQRMAPLHTHMTRFGAYRPNDVSRVDAVKLRIGGQEVPTVPITEMFSPGAFQALPDDDKLRSPAFVPLQAGLRVDDPATLRTTHPVGRQSRYDLIVFDSGADPNHPRQGTEQPPRPAPAESHEHFAVQVRAGVVGHGPAARSLAEQAEAGQVLAVGPATERYGVTRTDDLRAVDGAGRVAPATKDSQGRAVLPEDVLLVRPDAEARARALRQAIGHDFQVVPESQLVVTA
jgi:hypothetical protein